MKRKLAICFIHAMLLVLLHMIYFNISINMPLENEMMTVVSKLENYFTGKEKFEKDSCVFINTGYNNSLVDWETEDGFEGNLVVTDRILLTRFFKIMADKGNQHKYIFCDIVFDRKSDNDSELNSEMARVDHLILPSPPTCIGDTILSCANKKNYAPAEYITYEGKVSKIGLYDRRKKTETLPLRMYEECGKNKCSINKLGIWYGINYIPHFIYPRFFYNVHSMKKFELSLGQAVMMLQASAMFYDNIFKGKKVVIGNFASDKHVTLVGFMPGSLILYNTYLTLEAGYHLHKPGWFLFLLISFSLLSYYELYFSRGKQKEGTNIYSVLHFLGLSGLCILLSLTSLLLFHIHTTIIPVVLYFKIYLFTRKLIKEKSWL